MKSKILIVDNEASIRNALHAILIEEGFEVLSAADGAEALAHLASHRFDLIVSDIRMPGMDGLTMLKKIREGGDRTPLIFVTAYNDYADTDTKGLDVLSIESKPMNPDRLLHLVRSHLPRSRGVGERVRVALIDDQAAASELMGELLTEGGFDVIRFTDPVAALKKISLDTDVAEILIIDYRMPGMSGFELVEQFRKRGVNLPVLFASGECVPALPKALRVAGLLQKPYTVDDLIEKISSVLHLSK